MHYLAHEEEGDNMDTHGHLEVICGPMFSGKTEELIRRIRRVEYARMRAIVFKPYIDDRYSKDQVVSHSAQKLDSIPVADSANIRSYLGKVAKPFHVIGLDEVHFFDAAIVDLCEDLVASGVRVIAAGLCEDYKGAPFGPMPLLLTHADMISKLFAVCMRCGRPASKSQRVNRQATEQTEDQLLVGAALHYEARCRSCFKSTVVTLSDAEIKADVDLVRAHV